MNQPNESRVSKGMSKDRAKGLSPVLRLMYRDLAQSLLEGVEAKKRKLDPLLKDPMIVLRVESRGKASHVEVIPGLWCPRGDNFYALCRITHIEKAAKKLLRRLEQTESEGS